MGLGLYERIEVWKRMGTGAAIRIQCFKRLSDGMFAVQNADYIRAPLSASSMPVSDRGFIELLLDDDPADRCTWFPSLAEAITDHERDFGFAE